MAVLPIVILGALRLAIPVVSPPELAQLYSVTAPFVMYTAFLVAFGSVIFLLVGLIPPEHRGITVGFAPLAISIAVLTAASTVDGPRVWLTVWPVILVLGLAGLWRLPGATVFRYSWVALLVVSVVVGCALGVRTGSGVLLWAQTGLALLAPVLLLAQYVEQQRTSEVPSVDTRTGS